MPEIKKYLSKDGLEDYNELLPHSATQVQEYVSDWLDEHPEATTTVEDNSITTVKLRDGCVTTPKLADESVTPNKISQDLYQLIVGNVLRGSDSGDIVSVSDAFPAFLIEVAINGKSMQNGTPIPSATVPIVSIDELALVIAGKNLFDAATWIDDGRIPSAETGALVPSTASHRSALMPLSVGTYTYSLVNGYANGPKYVHAYDSNGTWLRTLVSTNAGAIGTTFSAVFTVTSDVAYVCIVSQIADTNIQIEFGSTAMAYEPYAGTTVQIPLQNNVLRSLPDGTHDTLALSYLRPSTHDGWAWYSKELVQRVGHIADMGGLTWAYTSTYEMFYATPNDIRVDDSEQTVLMCSDYAGYANTTVNNLKNNMPDKSLAQRKSYATVYVKNSDYSDVTAFATSLNGVTLIYPLATPVTTQLDPIELPVLPAPNCTVYAEPTTGITLSYERDLTIAINAIEQAIADL